MFVNTNNNESTSIGGEGKITDCEKDSLRLMGGQSQQEDNEELVGIPEHLEVRATDELHGRGDHQEQSHGDHMTRDARRRHETGCDGIL